MNCGSKLILQNVQGPRARATMHMAHGLGGGGGGRAQPPHFEIHRLHRGPQTGPQENMQIDVSAVRSSQETLHAG